MRVQVHLRASVWLDACLHAPVWWSQHQHRPWYIAGVDTYQVRSTDFATNRRFWSMMTSVKGIDAEPPAGMDELRYYGADLECRVTISGTKLNFFAVGSLENRRVRQHTYHTVWSGAAERTATPCAPVLAVWNRGASIISSRGAAVAVDESYDVGGGQWGVILFGNGCQRAERSPLSLSVLLDALRLVQNPVTNLTPAWFLTNEMCAAGRAEHAGVWGLVRSARQESPSARLRCMDVSALSLRVWRDIFTFPPEAAEVRQKGQTFAAPRLTRMPMAAAKEGSARLSNTHVVTGGTGGLGVLTARWLADRGVERLLLASRKGKVAPSSKANFQRLKQSKTAVLVSICDVGEMTGVRRLCSDTLPQGFSGIWHTASVLADKLVGAQTAHTLQPVFASKVSGTAALLAGSSQAPTDQFVLFSSIAGLFFGMAQSNYASANTTLDATASGRLMRGQAALAVQWGPWAEVGMATASVVRTRMHSSGLGLIDPTYGLVALQGLIFGSAKDAAVAVSPMKWPLFLKHLGPATPSLLGAFAAQPLPDAPEAHATPLELSLSMPASDIAAGLRSLSLVVVNLDGTIEPDQNLLASLCARTKPLIVACDADVRGSVATLMLCSATFAVTTARSTFISDQGALDSLPAWASSKLTRRIAPSTLASKGEAVNASTALELGLVDVVCSSDGAMAEEILRLAKRAASRDAAEQRLPASVEEALLAITERTVVEGINARAVVSLRVDESAGVAVVELNDPENFNTLAHEMARDMAAVTRRISMLAQQSVNAVTLQGKGKHFCPGGNLHRLRRSQSLDLRASARAALDLFEGFCGLRTLPLPVASATHGVVQGAGFAACLLTDAIAADQATTFQVGELPRGISPAGLLTRTLPDAIGYARAMRLYLLDEKLTAAEAAKCGMVQLVCASKDKVQARVFEMACRYSAHTTSDFKDLRAHVLAVSAGLSLSERRALGLEAMAQARSYQSAPVAPVTDRTVANASALNLEQTDLQITTPVPSTPSPSFAVPMVLTAGAIEKMTEKLRAHRPSSVSFVPEEGAPSFCHGQEGDVAEALAALLMMLKASGARSHTICRGKTRDSGMLFLGVSKMVMAHPDASFGFTDLKAMGVGAAALSGRLSNADVERLLLIGDTIDAWEVCCSPAARNEGTRPTRQRKSCLCRLPHSPIMCIVHRRHCGSGWSIL